MTTQAASDSRRDLLLAARGGGLKILGTLFRLVGGLGVSITIARLTGASSFGHYFVGVTCAEMLAQVAGLGLQSSILRFIPVAEQSRDEHGRVAIVRAGTLIPTAIGLLLAFATYVLADPLAEGIFGDPALAPSLRIFSLAIPLTALINSLEAALRGSNRVDLSTIGSDVGFQLPKFLLIAIALFAGFGVTGAAWAHAGALAVSASLLFWFVRRLTPGLLDAPVAAYRMAELWQQALPVYLTRLLRIFNGRLELLLLGAIGLSADVGVYAVALQIGMVGAMLTESLITVTMPLLSGAHHRGGEDALRPLVKTVTRWCLMATLPYYVALVLFADPILSLFGNEFGDGRTGLLLLGVLPLLNSAAGIAAEALAMTGNARLNTFNSIAYLALTVALDLALIPVYGIAGAAAAVVAATFVLNSLRTAQVRWLFGFWPLDLQIGKPILASLAAGLAGFAARMVFGDAGNIVLLAIGASTVAGTYAITLFLLGASEQDRHVIDAIARKLPILERITSLARRSD